MSAEDKLREILRSEATTVVPAGDGLARIRERVERRRRVRVWLLPSAALATAAVAAAFFLISPGGHSPQTLQQATASPTTTEAPTPTANPTTGVPDDGGYPLDHAAIWPFTSQAEARGWQTTAPWAQDGLQVGKHFVTDHLGLTGVTVTQSCVSCDALGLEVAGQSVGQIDLARVGVGFSTGSGAQVYTVMDVTSSDLTVTSPKAGTAIASPTRVTGRVQGVDENVALRLLAQSGDELATTTAPAGSDAPWSGTLTWSNTSWTHAAIVGVTRTNKDGAINRVVAVPVRRSDATPTSTFAGLVDGHVALFDSTTGKQVRQLTYPPKGKADSALSWSAGSLAWVRTAGASACVNELDRLDNGTASTVATSTKVRYGSPVLSPDANWLAWVETPCGSDSGGEVVVTVQGTPSRRIAVPSGSYAIANDITDSGALLVSVGASAPPKVHLLGVHDTSLDQGAQLSTTSGCDLASGAAFDGPEVVAFQTCTNDITLVRYSDKGARTGADPTFTGEPPNSISVRDGQVLVWMFGGDGVGQIARYADGRTTPVIRNDGTGCIVNGDMKGCVSSPDW